MKLTAFSKILITLLVLGVLYFLYTKFFRPALATGGGAVTEQVEQKSKVPASTKPSGGSSAARKTFDYTSPKPVGGKLKGVVELGASGFNSFIVDIDRAKNWELKKAEWGNSMVYDNMASADDIRAGLKRYITNILDYGVDGKNVHFVVSSGAQKVSSTQKIITQLKKMGYVVNTVTPEQEAGYALKAAMPSSFSNSAFVVDIGSGNTEISWVQSGGSTRGLESYGAKYYKNNTDDETVYRDVLSKAKQVPMNRRSTCFMIGGVPYKLAKEVRQGKERYTVLKAPEGYNAEGAKMKSGLNIYRAIRDATKCDQYVFDWDANFTIGFLLGL